MGKLVQVNKEVISSAVSALAVDGIDSDNVVCSNPLNNPILTIPCLHHCLYPSCSLTGTADLGKLCKPVLNTERTRPSGSSGQRLLEIMYTESMTWLRTLPATFSVASDQLPEMQPPSLFMYAPFMPGLNILLIVSALRQQRKASFPVPRIRERMAFQVPVVFCFFLGMLNEYDVTTLT